MNPDDKYAYTSFKENKIILASKGHEIVDRELMTL